MAEIYPLGGGPVRLPAAVLPCGEEQPHISSPHAGPHLKFLMRPARCTACLQRWAALLPACCSAPVQLVQLCGNIDPTLLSGAGDRLGLTCSVTGEGLPVAVLPYCGRPLLESLIRDVQVSLHGHAAWSALAALAAATCCCGC